MLKGKANARLGMVGSNDVLEVIPTGSVALDLLTGIDGLKGIPKGRVTQIASDPGVGKSTTALQIAANCQKLGGKVLYLDFEQAMTAAYAIQMGCNLDDNTMVLAQPTDLEIAWELIAQMSECGVSLVILDSIASMFPKVEDEDMASLKTQLGFQSRALALFFPRLKNQARTKNFAVLTINQVRAKIDFSFGSQFQKTPAYSQSLPGGYAVKFNTDLLYYLSIKKTEKQKGGTTVAGQSGDIYTGVEILATTWKNKVGKPFCRVPMYLTFGAGIDDVRSVLEIGVSQGIIDVKRNGFWSINNLDNDYPGIAEGAVILGGRGIELGTEEDPKPESLPTLLAANPEVYDYVRRKILSSGPVDSMDAEEAAAVKAMMSDDEAPSSGFTPTPVR